MKKLCILLFFISISIHGYSQPDTNKIIGKWKYTVDTGQGLMTGIFNFNEKEGILVGEVITDDGYTIPFTKIEPKEANTLYLELIPEYDVIKITVVIEEDKFEGTGSSTDGEVLITGEKQ